MKKTVILLMALYFCLIPNAHAFDPDQIEIHGFISQGYLKSDNNDYHFANTEEGTFQFDEFGINFSTELTDNLRAGIQFLSRDLGEYGNNDIEIDWAFGDYRYRNWLGIRAGKMKKSLGLYNSSRDIEAARTCILLPSSIYPESGRDFQVATTGIGIYGTLPGKIEYEMQYGIGDLDKDSAVAVMVARSLGETVDIDTDPIFIANLEWNTPLDGLKLGGTYIPDTSWTQEFAIGTLDFSIEQFILSAEYTYDEFRCAAEYKWGYQEREFNGVKSPDETGEHYYVLMSYRFTEWFELGSYYSVSYSDKDDKDGERFTKAGRPAARAWMKDFAISTRFDINEYWIFKLEGHIIDGMTQVIVTSSDEDSSEDGFLFAAKMTFSF